MTSVSLRPAHGPYDKTHLYLRIKIGSRVPLNFHVASARVEALEAVPQVL